MAFRLRILRARAPVASSYIGTDGQIVLDIDNQQLYLHDGVTVGGTQLGLSNTQIQAVIHNALAEYSFTEDEALKLNSVADGATKNAPDEMLLNRQNHTGTQPANTIEGLATGAFSEIGNFPFVNLMPDSGRFAGRMNPLSLNVSPTFQFSPFLYPYNGGTVVSAGRFIHNNTNDGGTAGTLTQSVIDLLDAIGRRVGTGNARYGVEYHIARFTAGQSKSVERIGLDGVTHYLLTVNDARCLFAAGQWATFSCWFRVVSGSVIIGSAHCYVNDVHEPYRTPQTPSGWKRLRSHAQSMGGYNNEWPSLFAVPGSVIEIALPAFFNGYVDPGHYISPIATVNELMV